MQLWKLGKEWPQQIAEMENWRRASQVVADDWYKEMTAKNLDGKMLHETAKALIVKHTK